MNSSKKTIGIVVVIVAVIVIIILVVAGRSSSPSSDNSGQNSNNPDTSGTNAPSIPATETKKVSDKTSLYQNDELGFSVSYPNTWEKDEVDTGVSFLMPIDQSQVSTVATLKADISASGGTCTFPPVTTVKDRGTLVAGGQTFNMITILNTVQGRTYFDRMYSLAKNGTCYMFTFSAISLAPETKKLSGSNLTQAVNNNKAIFNTADADFTTMVKTFALVQSAPGINESQAPQVKK